MANGLLLIVLLESHFKNVCIVGKEIFNISISYEGSPFFS